MKKKLLPKLTSNFESLVTSGSFFVDKTQYIQQLESLNAPNLFFLRPRRFGKSLLLSMLEHYYGIQHKDRFEELFGEYHVGKPGNSTPLRNSYYILKFNFSGIKTDEPGKIFMHFTTEVRGAVDLFLNSYKLVSNEERESIYSLDDANTILRNALFKILSNRPGIKIYLLIDEYDHFTNELFSFNNPHFKEIVSRNGWVRKFYEAIKIYMGEGLIDRFFATGVTPVTLDSMTSGFNVARNISLDDRFNEMGGFTEAELKDLIVNTIYEEGAFNLDQVVEDMRAWYNGSRFSPEGGAKLYNPQMVVTFLSDFSRNYEYPVRMLDPNITSDYKKIANILEPLPKEIKDDITEDVLNKEQIAEGLTIQYNFERDYTKTDAVSLLYYNGLLTIDDSFAGLMTYGIPNYVVKQLYWEFFRAIKEKEDKFHFDIGEIGQSLKAMALEGTIERLTNYAQKVMRSISFRDLQNFSEKHLKMIFMTILAGNAAYFVTSELETGKGYADIFLKKTKVNTGRWDHLIELKYMKANDTRSLDELIIQGKEQITKYLDTLHTEDRENLKTWLLIFRGKAELKMYEV